MTTLRIDFETRATVDLKATGVYPYARHPETDVWCMAWAFDDEDVALWVPGNPCPARIYEHVWDHTPAFGEIRAWNAQFERLIWKHIMEPRYDFPLCADERFVCTAAEAAAMALPRSLDHASKVLRVSHTKDEEGYALMLRMSRPRKVHPDGHLEWWTDADKLARLYEYCKQDVRTERAIEKALRRLSPAEREVYLLDQRMNDRGIGIDRPLIEKAQALVDEGLERAGLALAELTGGAVTKVSQNAKLAKYLDVESLAKDKVVDFLADPDLDPAAREILVVRSENARTSNAKLRTFLHVAGGTDRIRGLTLYHGAATGRFTGKLVQPHNFPRGDVPHIEQYIPMVMGMTYDELNSVCNPLQVVSSMLRSMMVAAPGHDLIAGDFTAIEARVLNWLAGQDDVTAMFAAGVDVYKHNATRLYGIPIERVQKLPHRQTGKFQELGCGYGMGWEKAMNAAKSTYGLTIDAAFAETIVDDYRERHPRVKQFWYDANDGVKEAVRTPGQVWILNLAGPGGGNVRAVCRGGYLFIILPSGRALCYARPRIVRTEPRQLTCPPSCKNPEPGHEHWTTPGEAVAFECVDGVTKRWVTERGYGGLWVENIVQAVARDLMVDAMLRLDAASYPLILSVHDEIVAEVEQGCGSVEAFETMMSAVPAWATGCPIAAEAWRGERYRKG